MKNLILLFPTLEMKKQALAYRQEYLDIGVTKISGSGGLDTIETYEEWFNKITFDLERDDGTFVSSTQFFAFVDNKIVGTIQIRHRLNDFLLNYGGHIGYGVAPSERKKGYATKMLSLALKKCWNMDIKKALVTCDKENLGSKKVVIKNKGVFENAVLYKDNLILCRYWIENPNCSKSL